MDSMTSSCSHAFGGVSHHKPNSVAALASQPVCHCLFDYSKLDDCRACTRHDYTIPAMVCVPSDPVHREKDLRCSLRPFVSACAARPVSRKAMRANAEARHSLQTEWNRTRSKGVWDESVVKEWSHVCAGAHTHTKNNHVDRVCGRGVETRHRTTSQRPHTDVHISCCVPRTYRH